ncbi:MAG: hypothetical protein GF350_10585 [Chitinivibrionales bacterium]|nr:hypothetical protein [Chitinivibrionales bacterium]
MSMRINHNIASMVGQGALFKVNREMSKSLERLSTGLRINTAADDAAGLGVSENLRTQVRGLGQAMRNAQDAIALLNIADGALNEQTEILQRMRELVIQAKNDTYTDTERQYMGQEFSQLIDELDRIAATANYNGMQIFATPEITEGDAVARVYTQNWAEETPHKLADARNAWDNNEDSVFGANDNASAHHFNMMIGANYSSADATAYNSGAAAESWDKGAANMMTIQFGQMDSNSILGPSPAAGIDGDVVIETAGNAFGWDITDVSDGGYDALIAFSYSGDTVQSKLEFIQDIIDGDPEQLIGGTQVTGLKRVNQMRAQIGAITNRLEAAVSNMATGQANQQSAESAIRDADFAQEATQFTRNQILSNSSVAMLSQANMVPQGVLQLL